jgi:hypothetical protein
MTATASRLRVLLLLPGSRSEADAAFATLAGSSDAVDFERLADGTENGLRERLARGDVDVLHFVGRGKVKAAAGYAVLELDASGGGTRTVNARHFASLLAPHAALRLVVVQPSSSGEQFAGLEAVLLQHGAPAALVTAAMPVRAGSFAKRLYGALATGATLEEASDAGREVLAGEPGQSDSVRLAASRSGPLASARPANAGAAEASANSAPAVAAPQAAAAPPTAREQREREIQHVLAQKRAAGQFDVFLCHNHVDKPAVKVIANALKSRGLLPWLDQWELPPGQPWQPLLERQIGNIRAAAVCVGQAGVGPWQEQELYGFLSEFVSRRAPVIPLLLQNAPAKPELPIFLRLMTYVDFGLADPDPMAQLEWGITGVRPEG